MSNDAKDNLPPLFTKNVSAQVLAACDAFQSLWMNESTRATLQARSDKESQYSGTWNTLTTIARKESIQSLWTGFPPYFLSKGTLTVMLFLVKEQYTRLARWLCAGGLWNILAP